MSSLPRPPPPLSPPIVFQRVASRTSVWGYSGGAMDEVGSFKRAKGEIRVCTWVWLLLGLSAGPQ